MRIFCGTSIENQLSNALVWSIFYQVFIYRANVEYIQYFEQVFTYWVSIKYFPMNKYLIIVPV